MYYTLYCDFVIACTFSSCRVLAVIMLINTTVHVIIIFSCLAVVIHPFTTVALVNTMANFTCSTDNTDHQPMVIINGKIITDAQLNETGITVVQSVPLQGFIIMIPASVDTNGTTVQCFVSPCITDEAYLIVVNCKLNIIITTIIIICINPYSPSLIYYPYSRC